MKISDIKKVSKSSPGKRIVPANVPQADSGRDTELTLLANFHTVFKI